MNFLQIEGIRTQGIPCINGKCISYNSSFPQLVRYEIRVCLGKKRAPRATLDVLRTLAHEYKHALLYKEGRKGDCKEATAFAAKILAELFPTESIRAI